MSEKFDLVVIGGGSGGVATRGVPRTATGRPGSRWRSPAVSAACVNVGLRAEEDHVERRRPRAAQHHALGIYGFRLAVQGHTGRAAPLVL